MQRSPRTPFGHARTPETWVATRRRNHCPEYERRSERVVRDGEQEGSAAPTRPVAKRLLCSRRYQVRDRKSTRLNSSHTVISYAVFCLKKKNGQESGAS